MTDPTTGIETPAPSRAPARHGRRLLWPALTLLALTTAVAGSAGYLARGGDTQAVDETAAPAGETARVTRETLADTRRFTGTLSHAAPTTVSAADQGVLTGIVDTGDPIEPGTELYRLDERPVTVLDGDVPMYRDLRHGDSGADVEQLIANLTELGHADCAATDTLTWCVEAAVREWRDDTGIPAPEVGVLARSDVVFVPELGAVNTVHAAVGDTLGPGSPVLDLTGTDHVVALEVETRDRDLLAVDTDVTVRLPGDEEAEGTVSAASVVANETGEDGGPEDTVTQVEVTLDDEVDTALLGAPADALVEVDERTDVLTVPVNALLARSEGGHAVEVVADDGTTTLVTVETGLFADGRVEIEGGGIEEGTTVGVAGR